MCIIRKSVAHALSIKKSCQYRPAHICEKACEYGKVVRLKDAACVTMKFGACGIREAISSINFVVLSHVLSSLMPGNVHNLRVNTIP